jgi:hypothetical protein
MKKKVTTTTRRKAIYASQNAKLHVIFDETHPLVSCNFKMSGEFRPPTFLEMMLRTFSTNLGLTEPSGELGSSILDFLILIHISL